MEQTIRKLAETVSGAGEDEAALLVALCGAAIRRWRGRLREGLTAEDCGTAFHCADLLSGGGDSAASFTAGQVSVKARTAAESAALAASLRRAAEELMAPYTVPGDFAFLGVRG